MNTEELAAMKARAELAARQGEVSVIDIVIAQDVPRLIAEVEALQDPVGSSSDVAQELIETAGRISEVESRSLLLAASRLVDQVIMENLRMTRRVEGLTEVVDSSLLVEMALMDEREKVARVEGLAATWEALGAADCAYHWDRLAEHVRAALVVPESEPDESEEGEVSS